MELFFAIIYAIAGLAFAIFCLYMAYRKATEESRQKAELQAQNQSAQARQRSEFQTIMSPHYGAMRNNYYSLHRTTTPPAEAARIDLETTVFGLPCKAQAIGGKLDNLLNDFHFWFSNNALYIFPTKDHLEEKHILYRTTVRDLPKKIDPLSKDGLKERIYNYCDISTMCDLRILSVPSIYNTSEQDTSLQDYESKLDRLYGIRQRTV